MRQRLEYALEKIRAICASEVDPFAADAGEVFVREKVKAIADRCEANAAFMRPPWPTQGGTRSRGAGRFDQRS